MLFYEVQIRFYSASNSHSFLTSTNTLTPRAISKTNLRRANTVSTTYQVQIPFLAFQPFHLLISLPESLNVNITINESKLVTLPFHLLHPTTLKLLQSITISIKQTNNTIRNSITSEKLFVKPRGLNQNLHDLLNTLQRAKTINFVRTRIIHEINNFLSLKPYRLSQRITPTILVITFFHATIINFFEEGPAVPSPQFD